MNRWRGKKWKQLLFTFLFFCHRLNLPCSNLNNSRDIESFEVLLLLIYTYNTMMAFHSNAKTQKFTIRTATATCQAICLARWRKTQNKPRCYHFPLEENFVGSRATTRQCDICVTCIRTTGSLFILFPPNFQLHCDSIGNKILHFNFLNKV